MLQPMDVQVYDAGGRRYRLTEGDRQLLESSGAIRPGKGVPPAALGPRHVEEDDEMDDADSSFVKQRPCGQHFVKLAADPQLFPFVIGKQGATKARIEQSSGATVHVPRKGQAGQEVEVTGPTAPAVASAFKQVEAVIHSAIAGPRLPYTHFVSIPLTSAEMQRRIEEFRDRLVADPRAAAEWKVFPETFQLPQKFHQTIAVLKLYTAGMRNAAQQVLKSFEGCLKGVPMKIAVRGLDIMNDDPSECHNLYAKLSDSGTDGTSGIQAFCDRVVQALSEADLLPGKDAGDVKLHATLLSSKFAARRGEAATREGGGAAGKLRRDPFDARAILAEEGGADFGEHSMECIHLSTMGPSGPDGYYMPLSTAVLV
mmetsp:Transcript_37057/g.104617  ORF Transcript_37057/g.104617 Transcript_37057/m.104617 type:complete len:370 (-) Transcript_37057:181-1290(-)